MAIEIPLPRGPSAFVSAVDADLAQYPWHLSAKGVPLYKGPLDPAAPWARHNARLARVVLSRMLGRALRMSETAVYGDGNPRNCQRENLELAPHRQYTPNGLDDIRTAPLPSIYLDRRRKHWCAEISSAGQKYYLGSFPTPEAAAAAVAAARLQGAAPAHHRTLEQASVEADGVYIPLPRGYTTVVDHDDADLAQYRWRYLDGYAARSVTIQQRQQVVRLQWLILERMLGRALRPGEQCQHIDDNRLNNRRANLRLATRQQSCWRQRARSDNTSGYRGVYFSKDKQRWYARITIEQKYRHLGYFATAAEAARAYNTAAQAAFGEFARLNPVESDER